MNHLLADVYLPVKLFNAGNPNESAWWVTLCNSNPKCPSEIYVLVSTILPNIAIVAGVVLLFITMGAGWSVISSSGKDQSAQDKAKAQAALTYGIIGFLLVVSAYFILQIVSTLLGVDFITPNI